jgi:hypothetical protein
MFRTLVIGVGWTTVFLLSAACQNAPPPPARTLHVRVEDWFTSAADCQPRYGSVKIEDEQQAVVGSASMRRPAGAEAQCDLEAWIPVQDASLYMVVFPGLPGPRPAEGSQLGPFGARALDERHGEIFIYNGETA